MWVGTKLREHPKALITKLYIEKYIVASLMKEGIVISLEILGLMGYRGSKSDSYISVKEQRADGSSIFYKYCKVCSKCQGNLVFIHPIKNVNTNRFGRLLNKQTKYIYSNTTSLRSEASFTQSVRSVACAATLSLIPLQGDKGCYAEN
uniref:LAGLIDADG endonuclease n=1 Tax=Ophiocordyceps sinensis TaxID=72228 RepID=A0A1X8VJM2_9HYPO|nr:LAGLIDADG endonuclease [Ophiocordyceps sinensis]ARF03377.1 LAGLIDADG endonuclease [Ophiocordyceps sinensis]